MAKKDELIEIVTVLRKSELEQISNLDLGEGLSFYRRIVYWYISTKPDRGAKISKVRIEDNALILETEFGDMVI